MIKEISNNLIKILLVFIGTVLAFLLAITAWFLIGYFGGMLFTLHTFWSHNQGTQTIVWVFWDVAYLLGTISTGIYIAEEI